MTEVLQVGGAVAAALAAAAGLLLDARRPRAAALAFALVISLALLAGEGWEELRSLRESPAALGALAAGVGVALGALALLFGRHPAALPLLLVAAMPFRIPIDVGTEDANLLLPLYAVIAAGVLAAIIRSARQGGRREAAEPRPLVVLLAVALVLYAAQSAYSEDLPFAVRNVGFFLVPFAVMFSLLAEVRWSPRLLAASLGVVVAEALVFAGVGLFQHIDGEIFWNPALEASNDFHFYFRVNSLFWDPNIYGRYLAMAAVLTLAVLLWTRDVRRQLALVAVLVVVMMGLTLALTQTSYISLLCGTAVLCALRWSALWTAVAAPIAAAAVVAAVLVIGGTSEAEDSASEVSSGRSTLVEGGLELAERRPLGGHGSASFAAAFSEQEGIDPATPPVSHNEPITVAAEQGAIGVLAYAGLVGVALWTLFAGLSRVAPGLRAPPDRIGDPAEGGEAALALARIAIAAAFCALLVHTIGYAGFLTDPLTWALLAIGAALAPARANA